MSTIIDFAKRTRAGISTDPQVEYPPNAPPRLSLFARMHCWCKSDQCAYRSGGCSPVHRIPIDFFRYDCATKEEVLRLLAFLTAMFPSAAVGKPELHVRDTSTPKRHPCRWELSVQIGQHRATVELPVYPMIGLARICDVSESGIDFRLPMPSGIVDVVTEAAEGVYRREIFATYNAAMGEFDAAQWYQTEPLTDKAGDGEIGEAAHARMLLSPA